MKKIIVILMIVLIVLIGLFILFPREVEGFLSKYPHSIDTLTTIFTLLTTIISVCVAYKAYSTNVKMINEDKRERSYKAKKLLRMNIDKPTKNLINFKSHYEFLERKGNENFFDDVFEQFQVMNQIIAIEDFIKEIRNSKMDNLTKEDDEKLENKMNLLNMTKSMIVVYEMHKKNKYPISELKESEKEIKMLIEDIIQVMSIREDY